MVEIHVHLSRKFERHEEHLRKFETMKVLSKAYCTDWNVLKEVQCKNVFLWKKKNEKQQFFTLKNALASHVFNFCNKPPSSLILTK